MTIGERIRAARKSKGMTQKQLAAKMNISYANISQLERDERNPTLETIQKIANALGIPLVDIIGSKETVDVAENENKTASFDEYIRSIGFKTKYDPADGYFWIEYGRKYGSDAYGLTDEELNQLQNFVNGLVDVAVKKFISEIDEPVIRKGKTSRV